jgi:ribose transport system permease protein
LQVIAGVVIGSTSLFGGSGGFTGSLIGIIIPVALLNGFVVLGLPPFWQQVAVGAVLIGAVYFDQLPVDSGIADGDACDVSRRSPSSKALIKSFKVSAA